MGMVVRGCMRVVAVLAACGWWAVSTDAALIDLAPAGTPLSPTNITAGSAAGVGRGLVLTPAANVELLGVGIEGFFPGDVVFKMSIIEEDAPVPGQDTVWRSATLNTGDESIGFEWLDFTFSQPFTLLEDVSYLVLFAFDSSPGFTGGISLPSYAPAFPVPIVDTALAPITIEAGREGASGTNGNSLVPHLRLVVPEATSASITAATTIACGLIRRHRVSRG